MSTSKSNTFVVILDWDGNFVTYGEIHGVEYVQGEYGWYTSLILRTTDGRKLEGWKYMIQPYDPTFQLGYNNGDADNTDR